MMTRTLLTAICLFCIYAAQAQNVPAPGNDRLYLHLDKEAYTAGETIWLKAYIHDDSMTVQSTSLHVEFIGDSGKIAMKKIFPVVNGVSFGQLEIDKDIRQNLYYLRAYSPEMLQTGEKQFYRMVPVLASSVTRGFVKVQPGSEVNFNFQPLCGVMVEGITNVFSYVAYNEFFQPLNVEKGEIKDSKQNVVSSFTLQYAGAGSFALTPQSGERYALSVTFENGTTREYLLPAAQPSGYFMLAANNAKGKKITVEKTSGAVAQGIFLKGTVNGVEVFNQPVTFSGNYGSFIIPVTNATRGLLELSLTSGTQTLCQTRVVNGTYHAENAVAVTPLQISGGAKDRNSFKIEYHDSVNASLSVSVIDAGFEIKQFAPPAIGPSLIAGRFLNQELTASASNETAYHELLLNSSLYKTPRPVAVTDTNPKKNIFFTAFATYESSGLAVKNKTISALIRQKDSSIQDFAIETDKDGFFRANSLFYSDTAQLIFFITEKKVRQNIIVQIADDKKFNNQLKPAYRAPLPLSVTKGWQFTTESSGPGVVSIPSSGVFTYNIKDMVTVVAPRKPNPTKAVVDRYVRGVFAGSPRKTIDLVSNPEVVSYPTVLQYIRANIFQVEEKFSNGSANLFLRRPPKYINRGNPAITIYLDEFLTDYNLLSSIYTRDVALIRFYDETASTALSSNGSGIIAIYTRKPQDYFINVENALYVKKLYGYSPVTDPLMPDYGKYSALKEKADSRSLLYWNPLLDISPGMRELPVYFYNSDKGKRFKVVVQGLTGDGRYIYHEQYLESQ
jgi:hypothetical protein